MNNKMQKTSKIDRSKIKGILMKCQKNIQKAVSRQEEFKKYVEDHELVEQFSDLFVTLYDKKMPQKQDADSTDQFMDYLQKCRLVKDFFCPNQVMQLRDNIENCKKENEFLRKQANDLKAKIKLLKENQPKRKTQTAGYFPN